MGLRPGSRRHAADSCDPAASRSSSSASPAPRARAAAQGKPDQPVDLDASGDVEPVTGENEHALSISGFGVGGYTYDGKTDDNSFAAGKVAVSLFRELTDNLYVFGQLTTSISDKGAGEPTTEIEIDNLLVSFTPQERVERQPHASGRSTPRSGSSATTRCCSSRRRPHSTSSWRGRPSSPDCSRAGASTGRSDLTALVANGWDSPLDPNHGKTVGARLGVLPAERASVGLSALYGSEGEADETNDRLLLDADYAFEPGHGWIVAGEANYAKDYDLPDGGRCALVRRDAAGPPPGGAALGARRTRGGVGRQGRRPHRPGADAHLLDHRADLLAGRGPRGDLRQHPAHDLPDPAVPAPGRAPR